MLAVNTIPKIVNKPWGREIWLQLNDRYVFKIIEMDAGHRSSLQYHVAKHETNSIASGELDLEIQDPAGEVVKNLKFPDDKFREVRFKTVRMKAGDVFTVPPPAVHRVNAISNIVMYEVSTPEVDDVLRLQDDAGRGSGRIESEHRQ